MQRSRNITVFHEKVTYLNCHV